MVKRRNDGKYRAGRTYMEGPRGPKARKDIPFWSGFLRAEARDLAILRHTMRMHDAHVRTFRAMSDAERWRWRYANDPEFGLRERIRRQLRKKSEAMPGVAELINGALRRDASSPRVESLLGYSIKQLKAHIERQFVKGMTWDGLSKSGWHIDHILPKKCFDLTSIEGVQAYWALSNLRPLWAKVNLTKRDKVLFLC